jgi:hypothetical protein
MGSHGKKEILGIFFALMVGESQIKKKNLIINFDAKFSYNKYI